MGLNLHWQVLGQKQCTLEREERYVNVPSEVYTRGANPHKACKKVA